MKEANSDLKKKKKKKKTLTGLCILYFSAGL